MFLSRGSFFGSTFEVEGLELGPSMLMSTTSGGGDEGVIEPARDVVPVIGGFQNKLGGGVEVEGVWNKKGVFEGDCVNAG